MYSNNLIKNLYTNVHRETGCYKYSIRECSIDHLNKPFNDGYLKKYKRSKTCKNKNFERFINL